MSVAAFDLLLGLHCFVAAVLPAPVMLSLQLCMRCLATLPPLPDSFIKGSAEAVRTQEGR